MASGVTVSDPCKEEYQCLKMNVAGKKKLRFLILKISSNYKEIVVDYDLMEGCDKMSAPEPEYFCEVVQRLPKDDGRYLIYDYPYMESFGKTSKIIMVLWCPVGLNIKKKMLYASSKDALKKCVSDIGAEFQADCVDDLSDKDIISKLRKV